MATKRMFANRITAGSGKFLTLPYVSQLLYYHLGMIADNSGYADYVKALTDLKLEVEALEPLQRLGYVTVYDPYTLRIRNFWENNDYKGDRHKPSDLEKTFPPVEDEKFQPFTPDYNLNRIQTVYTPYTDRTVVYNSIVENSIVENKEKEKEKEIGNNDDALKKATVAKNATTDFLVNEIIRYLNEKANHKFTVTPEYKTLIKQRIVKNNATLDDFIMVINFKCAEWIGTDFEQHLTPSTLFIPKHFSTYLAQAKKAKEKLAQPIKKGVI